MYISGIMDQFGRGDISLGSKVPYTLQSEDLELAYLDPTELKG